MDFSPVATGYSRFVQELFTTSLKVGSVQSIFQRAINIVLHDGEQVISLLCEELPRMPQGIQLSHAHMEWLRASLRPGMPLWIGERRLSVPSTGYMLVLPETSAWEPRPAVESMLWNVETMACHTQTLARYLAEHAPSNGLASLVKPLILDDGTDPGWPAGGGVQVGIQADLIHMAEPKLRMLMQAGQRSDIHGVEEATRGLAGLGPGLTPSGDDTLCGFAAVMALLSPYLTRDGLSLRWVAEVIASTARSRTTKLSVTLLGHAARGEVAEHIGDVLLALALPIEGHENVLRAAKRLLAFGATSGSDTLLGILLGLRVLERIGKR
jgi:hypothetical protein